MLRGAGRNENRHQQSTVTICAAIDDAVEQPTIRRASTERVGQRQAQERGCSILPYGTTAAAGTFEYVNGKSFAPTGQVLANAFR